MDYKNADGTWVGFDADLAKAFAESIGVTAEFIVIDWDSKIMELNNGSIDVVWNGMTLDDGVKAAMSTSGAYCRNAQVVVVPADKANQYQTKENLSGLTFAGGKRSRRGGPSQGRRMDRHPGPEPGRCPEGSGRRDLRRLHHRPADGRGHDRGRHQLPRPHSHRGAEQRGIRRRLPERLPT